MAKPLQTRVSEASMDSIFNRLECPICFEHFAGLKIYQCINGHSICSDCNEKVQICPTCRSERKGPRNTGLEGIVDDLSFKCRNEGCPMTLKGSQMQGHLLKECEFRLNKPTIKGFKCVETNGFNCKNGIKTLIDPSQFVNHLQLVHNATKLETGSEVISFSTSNFNKGVIEDWASRPLLLEFDGRIFNVRKWLVGGEHGLFISLIGTEEDGKGYSSTLQVYEQDFKSVLKEEVIPIHSYHCQSDHKYIDWERNLECIPISFTLSPRDIIKYCYFHQDQFHLALHLDIKEREMAAPVDTEYYQDEEDETTQGESPNTQMQQNANAFYLAFLN